MQAIVDQYHDIKTATKVRFQEPEGETKEGKGEKEEKEEADVAPEAAGEVKKPKDGQGDAPQSPGNQANIKP